jgi:HEAT repeat protein
VQVRAALIRLLATSGSHDALVRAAFGDPAAAVRVAALNGLAERRDHRLLDDYLRCMGDGDDGVACAAICALGMLRLPETVDPLLAALEGNRRGAVGAAGYALRDLQLSPVQRRRMLLALVRALRDDGVRWSAMSADWQLEQDHTDDVVHILRASLDDPDYQCRQFVAQQLRMRELPGDERLAEVTIEGLQDDDYPYDRSGSYMTYLCNAKWGTRWLWLHPEVGTAGLRRALTSTDAQQRFLAAWLLAMREDGESAEAICRELIPRLRELAGKPAALWAIQAIFHFGQPARQWVESALPGEDERQAACLWLLLRDWDDPPRDRFDAARRWHLSLSHLYHDPAWEPALAAPGRLPEPFPDVAERRP